MITIDYFSDLLCVWAYGGQVRLEELQRTFGAEVLVRQRFMPLFADTATRIGEGWNDKGGFEGFGRHIHEVCSQWEHTQLHPQVWGACRPRSSVTAHAFLKAVALYLGLQDDATSTDDDHRQRFDDLVARTRRGFFEQAHDISALPVLLDLLASTDIPVDGVRARFENGEAFAALQRDAELMKTYGVLGSPTYVFNEGRQLLYGNVGYHIIEANIRELMSARPVAGEPSWC